MRKTEARYSAAIGSASRYSASTCRKSKFPLTLFLCQIIFCLLVFSCVTTQKAGLQSFESEPCAFRIIKTAWKTDSSEMQTASSEETYVGTHEPAGTKTSASGGAQTPFLEPEEILSDTEEFLYLFKTCYAGNKKARQNGLNPDTVYENIKKRFSGRTKIPQDEFCWALWKETYHYINDMHFVLESQKSYYTFCPHKIPFFSNTYVKKEGSKSLVFLTDSKNIQIGDEYTGSEQNLFYYPSRGLDVYRIGVILDKNKIMKEQAALRDTKSAQKTNSEILFETSINGKKERIPVRDFGELEIPESFQFKESETEKTAYIYISSFLTPEAESEERTKTEKKFTSYADAAKKYLAKQNIILDLRGNEGGNMNASLVFPINLYLGIDSSFYDGKKFDSNDMADFFIRELYKDCFLIESPGTVQNTLEYVNLCFPEMKETIDFLEERYKKLKKKPEVSIFPMNEYASTSSKMDFSIPEKSAFTGNLFIITDRNSFSASEDIITFSKLLFKNQANVYVLGENTAGCIEYGGVLSYKLTSSNITVNLSQSAFYPFEEKVSSWKGEGNGHFPDAWCTPEDIRKTLELLCY